MKIVLIKATNVEVFYPLDFHTESDCCSCRCKTDRHHCFKSGIIIGGGVLNGFS